MKLNINKSYIVYTNSNYIENKQIRVLGYINYDRASQYQSMIENIAINEIIPRAISFNLLPMSLSQTKSS